VGGVKKTQEKKNTEKKGSAEARKKQGLWGKLQEGEGRTVSPGGNGKTRIPQREFKAGERKKRQEKKRITESPEPLNQANLGGVIYSYKEQVEKQKKNKVREKKKKSRKRKKVRAQHHPRAAFHQRACCGKTRKRGGRN